MFYVYVLKGDKKHYIGSTNDIERRLLEHKRGNTQTTKILKVNLFIGYFEKKTKQEAERLERIIKKDGHINHWINHPTFVRVNRAI